MPVQKVRNVRAWCGPVRVHGCLRKPDRPVASDQRRCENNGGACASTRRTCAGPVTTSQGCVYNVVSSAGTTGGSPATSTTSTSTTTVFLYMFRQWGSGEVGVPVGARRCLSARSTATVSKHRILFLPPPRENSRQSLYFSVRSHFSWRESEQKGTLTGRRRLNRQRHHNHHG